MTNKDIEQFISQQIEEWPQARDNFAALSNVKVKQLDVDGTKIKVQFNPARIVSSAAKVDQKSVQERKCFLCAANRSDAQKAIEWGGHYEILVNPFPIFPRHLTIPDKSHTAQSISGRIADMVALAADLKGYTVFYNGPRCGASAPDHMHFQAGNSDFLTLEENLSKADLQPLVVAPDGEAVLSLATGILPAMFVIDTTDAHTAQEMFDRLCSALPVAEGDTEPMMNILCYVTDEGDARIVVIPRKRHRPSFYGTEGDNAILLSPAAVDMGGVFITPREIDFNRLDSSLVATVFDEVCLNEQDINEIIDRL